jgi:energy-coupling factor transport system permease protein
LITNIAIGQYYPAESPIHAMDPRVKLIGVIMYISALFMISGIAGYAFIILSIGALIRLSRVPFRFMLKGLRGIMFIMLFTVVLNIFFTPGEKLILQFYFIRITQEGLILAFKMGLRLALLIIGSSLLTLTTSPIELTDALEQLMKPLKRLGVPAHEIAMMMTIALRFIPTLVEEMDKIMKAQTARGADFDTGGIVKKARSLIPLLVPLFISSFRRADELALAMEARCYRGDVNRTRMKELKLSRLDMKAIGFMSLFAAMIAAIRIFLG